MCLDALRCFHVIGSLDICIKEQLIKWSVSVYNTPKRF